MDKISNSNTVNEVKNSIGNYFNIPGALSNEEILVYFHLCKSTNFTLEEYEGRKRFECFCSKRTLSNDTGIGDKKILKVLKELEEKKYIELIRKGKPPKTPSIYKLIYAEKIKKMEPIKEPIKEPLKEPLKEPFEDIENTEVREMKEPLKEPLKEPSKEPLMEPPSIYISKDNSKDINIYSIFEYWNSKEIIRHKEMNSAIEKAINNALKTYSVDELKQGIDNYNEILRSSYYFDYKWTLKDFLNRQNGISSFVNGGNNKTNYDNWKNRRGDNKPNNKVKSTKQANFTQRNYDFESLERQLLGWD